MLRQWKNIPLLKPFGIEVPPAPGIYAITHAERALGLPMRNRIVYVGRSVNLRRRFREHESTWRHRVGMQVPQVISDN